MASKPMPGWRGHGGKQAVSPRPCGTAPRAVTPPRPGPLYLLIPADLPPPGEGGIHDVVAHQQEGLQLQKAHGTQPRGSCQRPSDPPRGCRCCPALSEEGQSGQRARPAVLCCGRF